MTAKITRLDEKKPVKRIVTRLMWATPVAMIASSAANLLLYSVAGAIFPETTAWPGAGPMQIVGANIVYLLFGALTYAIVSRFSTQPKRHYLIVATIGLLLSLTLPVSAGFGYGAPGTPPASLPTVIMLSCMHLVTYAVSVPLFIRNK